MDDAALLRAAAAADTRAFDTFMHGHQAAVHRYALILTENRADAEDVLQETFIGAWRAAGTYAGTGSARAWLYAIARNVVRHHRRTRVGEPAHLESIEALGERAGWGALPAVGRESAADVARDVLAQAMRQVPPEEREVLTLRELDGFSGEETAALLHLSIPAMKSRLHRARIHLAAAIRAQHLSQFRSTAHA
jgi:RNA polymerase sigma-70 factor, ECF subfamily